MMRDIIEEAVAMEVGVGRSLIQIIESSIKIVSPEIKIESALTPSK